MKNFLSALFAIIMAISFTACSKQNTYTIQQAEEIVTPYMYNISFGLSKNWSGSKDDNLLTAVNGDIFKSILESFWRADNGTEIYDENYKVKLDDYVSVATEYFAYDEADIIEHFKADKTYDPQTDLLSSHDALGSVINMELASVEQQGDVFKVNYDCHGVDGYYVADYGYITVEITKNGKPKFLSNTVNNNQTENAQQQEQSQQPQQLPESTLEFDRIFDTWDNEGLCQELLQMFALCAYDDWSYDNEDALLNCGKGTGFPDYVNTLYRYDTGETLIDSNGYANIDDLVKYAVKYFDVNENTVRKDFERHPNYNSADGTILFDGGIGNVTGVNYIEVTQETKDEITYYVIDYAISEPEDPRFKYSKLTYTKNDDGSFKFIRNKHYGTEYSPSYDLHQLSQREAMTISKDGRYRLHWGNGFGAGDSSSQEVFLCDAQNGNCISLGIIIKNQISDAGFFANGDAYTMDYTGLNVYSTSETNSNKCDLIFTTKTNFPGGVTVDSGPYSRYIFAVRRDPVTYEYIVIYADCIYSDPANDFQLKENYKVGLLDKEGNLKQSWDTGVPVMFTVMGFESVYMTKPSETEIEFFVKYKTEERLRGKFNLETGVYTPVKEFEPW